VSYGQIPRADRAQRHRAVAEWLGGLGREADHAEMLAHHWQSALELSSAAGVADAELHERTRTALTEAGDRAFALNAFLPAVKYFSGAIDLSTPDSPDYATLLFRWARSLHVAAADGREQALLEARDALLEAGEHERAAETEAFLSHGAWYEGNRDAADAHIAAARALVAGRGASAAKARVLSFSARLLMLAGKSEEALETARTALELAELLSLDELRIHALTTIGSSLHRIDHSGGSELEEALAIALAANSPLAANALNNLGVSAVWEGNWARAHEISLEAQVVAERFGERDMLRFLRGNDIYNRWVMGYWNEAAEAADPFIAECKSSPNYAEGLVRSARAFLRLGRGDADGALEDVDSALAQARDIKDPQRVLPSLVASARVYALLGRVDEAREHAQEALRVARKNVQLAAAMHDLDVVAERLEIRKELREILELAPEGPWKDLALAGAAGDLTGVADMFVGFGARTWEAENRLFGGESLIADGRRAEGEAEIEQALDFYREVGATFFVRRAEASLTTSAYSDSA
jgi:tetratricopeptide (TPR) repeat protein